MRMLQTPRCDWVIFVDTRKLGDYDYFVEHHDTRVNARKSAANYRSRNCRVVIVHGLGGMAKIPKWYVANQFDKLVNADYLSGN